MGSAFRRRVLETLYRKPDDMRIWTQMMGLVTRGGEKSGPEATAERMAAVLKHLDDQILPPE